MHVIVRLRFALPILLIAAVCVNSRPAPVVAEDTVTVIRLVIADADTGALTVLDAADGRTIATFGTPSANPGVTASPSGRWVYAVNTAANRVTILDTGLRLEDHGDHADLVVGPPFVRGTIVTGRRPIDFWAQRGMATVHNDDDGTLAVFDEGRLEVALDYTEIRGAGTGHNNAVVLGDTVLLSLASAGRITAYRMDNSIVTSFEGCLGTHGWTTRGATAAAGCIDGVMLITNSPAGLMAKKVAEPAGSPDTARVSTLISHEQSPVLIGNFGQGLAIIQPDADLMQVVPLPSMPVRFLFDAAGTRLVVVTLDGMVHVLEPATGRILGSMAAVTPIRTGDGAPPTALMAVTATTAYVTDPQAGQVVAVDLAGPSLARRMNVGGAPRGIAAVAMTGVQD
jgi:DNA-binding beta-propeller fold protein YncE